MPGIRALFFAYTLPKEKWRVLVPQMVRAERGLGHHAGQLFILPGMAPRSREMNGSAQSVNQVTGVQCDSEVM